jgi:hypothetical protein
VGLKENCGCTWRRSVWITKRKETRDANGMLRIISERHKAFDRVKWVKFMQILNENGIDWRWGRLISKLNMNQCVKHD